jgi:hypothetical protein
MDSSDQNSSVPNNLVTPPDDSEYNDKIFRGIDHRDEDYW